MPVEHFVFQLLPRKSPSLGNVESCLFLFKTSEGVQHCRGACMFGCDPITHVSELSPRILKRLVWLSGERSLADDLLRALAISQIL